MPDTIKLPGFLCCPECHEDLVTDNESTRCRNGHTYGVVDGYLDFFQSSSVDADLPNLDAVQETMGMRKRGDNFLLPWLKQFNAETVLDDGCGVGYTVEYLCQNGIDAYGIDPGQRTRWWAERAEGSRSRLFRADGLKLPFADASFDAILSSGVIEHIGEPLPRRQQHPYQRAYIHEMLRVLRPNGRALIAAPNGAFPIDFWHGSVRPIRTPLRVHMPYEAWMPNAREVAGWVSSAPVDTEVKILPPNGYLAFDTVRTHWYGRAFSGLMASVFRLIDRYPGLAATPINPWLIVEVQRGP